MGIRVVGPGEGETVNAGPIGIRIIEDGSQTGHRLGLIEATIPPGPAQPPQQGHPLMKRSLGVRGHGSLDGAADRCGPRPR